MPSPYERQRPQSAVVVLRTLGKLGSESRLADAGWADDDGDAHRPGIDRALQLPAQSSQLAFPPDERRVQPALERG